MEAKLRANENALQNQNQIYSLEQYTVIPTATYSFVPPRCRRGRLAAAFPRPHVSGRLAPASAWAVWPWSLPPVCSLPRVCYLSIAILSRLHTILGALTLRRRPAVTLSSARTSLEQRSLSPGVTAPLSWLLPIRLPPLARRRARRLYLHRRRRVVTNRRRSRTLSRTSSHHVAAAQGRSTWPPMRHESGRHRRTASWRGPPQPPAPLCCAPSSPPPPA